MFHVVDSLAFIEPRARTNTIRSARNPLVSVGQKVSFAPTRTHSRQLFRNILRQHSRQHKHVCSVLREMSQVRTATHDLYMGLASPFQMAGLPVEMSYMCHVELALHSDDLTLRSAQVCLSAQALCLAQKRSASASARFSECHSLILYYNTCLWLSVHH